jgi:hypothetical protein
MVMKEKYQMKMVIKLNPIRLKVVKIDRHKIDVHENLNSFTKRNRGEI